MKKLKITLAERIAALVVAIALLVGLAPETLLLVTAETEEHMGTYTLSVCDEHGNPLSGAEVSWAICDEDGSNAVEQEKKTSGEDGVCEMGEINSIFLEAEDGPEKVCFKITDIDQFGYTYTGQNAEAADQNIYVVEMADQNGHQEIRLSEKEAGTLTGRVETAEGEALKNVEILVEPGGKTVQTNAEGSYTVEGLYVGETYTVSASLKGYIAQTESVYIDGNTYWDFVLDAKKADAAFQFQNGKTPEIVYGANGNKYSNLIVDDLSVLAPIEYRITEERNAEGEIVGSETIAVISEGELTVLAAGTVVVEASNKDYQDSYTLTINKSDQSIAFPEGDQSFTYGEREEYVHEAEEVENLDNADGKGYNDEPICYEIEGENPLEAVVDENGTVTWGSGKTGSITVKASKAEDACYNACEATYKLTVEAADQKIAFEQKEIKMSYGMKELSLNASVVDGTGQNGQPIEYRIEGTNELEAEIKTNKLIFKEGKTGSVTVKAMKAGGEGYNACEATCTVIIEKADQSIKFNSDSVTLTYGEQNDYTLEVNEVWNTESIDGKGYNDTPVCYEIEGENPLDAVVDMNGTVTWGTGKIGSITVKASKAEDACYNACEATYKLTIEAADQKIAFDQEKIEMSYGIKELSLNASVVDGTGQNGQPIEYRIEGTNELEAEIKTNKLIFKEGKIGSITVKAVKAGGEGYNACEATCTVIIKAAEQKIAFDEIKKILTYGEKEFTQLASEVKIPDSIDGKGHNDKPIVYSIEGDNPTTVSVDSTGTVSFNKETIGEITVKATKPADEEGLYEEASATYVIKIEKANQSIKFNQDSVVLTYGEQNDYTVKASAVEDTENIDGVGYNDEKIKYSIVEGENSLGAEIDEKTGKVTFVSGGASGKVKIKAVKPANEYYNASSASYITIEMKPLSVDGSMKPTLEGTSKNGWYSSAVKIHAPEGYHISDNNGTGNENWKKTSFTYRKEGKNNVVVYLRSDETKGITSEISISDIKIDTTKPVVEVSYDTTKPVKSNYYKTTRTATIKIIEANFDASEVNVTITAKNISGKTVSSKASISSWKTDKTDSSIHTATVTFPGSAAYTLDISGEDIAGNTSLPYKQDKFVVDQSAPKTSDMKISYSKELKSWEKVINKVTFGYYAYKKGVTVTLTAKDNISGIDKMKWTYTQEDGTSTDKNVKKKEGTISGSAIKYSSDGTTATASFKLTASEAEQFRGSISFTATDRAGNTSKLKQDSERVNVVDTIAPKRKVSFTPAKQVINGKMYYDGPVTAAFQITEANFNSRDVVIRVNGKKKTPKNWKQEKDTWTGSIKITGDGEYVVTVTYKDRSNNQMKKYTSKKIVIDTKDPVIKVSYGNKDSKNTEGGAKYFDDVQTAAITIREQNFRAKDVKAKVTAKDINGNDVSVMDYAAYLSNKKNWKKSGDTYTATISFTEDANYTFDIVYRDLTKRAAADYRDSFTVDKTAPQNLTVSYSNSLVDKVLNALTFGYYNAPMTVTVSAEDATSGIAQFTYSCRRDSGVSGVNAELIDAAIQKADIVQNGSTFRASFRIPQQALENANQFNGTVDFCAYDYAANNSAKADDKRIVVDNIKPTADVTFGDPVREAGNISYYAGDILATVVIHEANFDASDVIVSVTKDGASLAVTPTWQDDGPDVHTGTFTLHEDGDYTVSVNYTDASSNEMEPYTSNQLTIDTQAPTVSVSNVKMNSANKDEVYSFTITASDTNFDTANFKPELTALIQNAQGKYVTETIDLGTMRTSEAGSTYSYSVSNLDADAVYKLVCTVSDMAGNEYTKLLLNEDQEEYDTVQFSINRNGSTYAVDEAAETLVEQYYIYGVSDDIKIEETNVDPVEAYTVKMNGESLTEGRDYTTTLTANEGEWCKRTYTIKKDLFDAEGEYNVVVESTDKTNTTAYSDVKNLNVSFVVDQTPPVLTISGLEENGRYQVQEQTVTVIPTDDGGKLESFQAVVLDADGDPSRDENGKDNSVRFDMSGEKFEEYLKENNGTITFTIPEGLERQVLLVCNDMALHTDGTTNECNEIFTGVTVSQSRWVIFYANKPLLYSMIAGIAILLLAVGTVIVLVRRRKIKRV